MNGFPAKKLDNGRAGMLSETFSFSYLALINQDKCGNEVSTKNF
jgi:hypothetical protein